MYDMLAERGAGHIRLFGGGGGVILHDEIQALHEYGIARVYSPDDGRSMGLQGMIDDMLRRSDFPVAIQSDVLPALPAKDLRDVARAITLLESFPDQHRPELRKRSAALETAPPAEEVLSPPKLETGPPLSPVSLTPPTNDTFPPTDC